MDPQIPDAAAAAATLNDALADLDVADLVFANDAANAALISVNNANLNVANARNASALADAALGEVNAALDNADAVNSALAAAAAVAAAALTAADAALTTANSALTAANADAANAAAVAVANAAAAAAAIPPRAVARVVVDAARVISIKDIAAVTTATAALHAAEADAAAAPPDAVADARVIVNTAAAQLRAATNAAAASGLVANLVGIDVAPLTPIDAIHAVIAAAAAADLDAVNANAAPPPQTARRASVFAARIIAKLNQVRPDVGNRHAYDQFGDAVGVDNGFAPVMFSIGPHHRNVGNLKYMEMHKWHCLNGMLEADLVRRYHLIRTCYDVLSGLEGLAREYYGGCIIDLGQHDFLEMLLLDGCFLISTFLNLHSQANPFLNSSWVHSTLQTDLLCLENQLPFSVVENLHRVIMIPNHQDQPFVLLMHAVKWSSISNFVALPAAAFRNFASIEYGITRALGDRLEERLRTTDENLTRIREQHGINIDPETVTQIDLEKLGNTAHFLHLSYKLLLSEDLLAQGGNENPQVQPQGVPPMAYLLDPTSLHKYSITELNNAGVKFKCVGGRTFYDIRFINKTLEIPEIYISKGLKARLQNVLAYEARCRQGYSGQILGDYITFMDSFINTAKDVELLRENGIIIHSLGSDEAVATLFNGIGAIAVRSKLFRYSNIVRQLKEHCGNWWNTQRATLKSKYFSNTWSIASVGAAVILLLLTGLQTFYTVDSYYKGP